MLTIHHLENSRSPDNLPTAIHALRSVHELVSHVNMAIRAGDQAKVDVAAAIGRLVNLETAAAVIPDLVRRIGELESVEAAKTGRYSLCATNMQMQTAK